MRNDAIDLEKVIDLIRIEYGLYGTSVAVEDGKYVLSYEIGDSCD